MNGGENEVSCPKDLIEWANSSLTIQWYLYDANLLPELIDTEKKVCALRGFQFGWKSAMHAIEKQKNKSSDNQNNWESV
jgi:hypothetical protein